MTRGGTLLAVALTLALAPAAAAGQSGSQPDLMIVGRDGAVLTGADIHNEGVGQQRSMIVDEQLTITVRIENDGDRRENYVIIGTAIRGRYEQFRVRYGVGQAVDRARLPRFDLRVHRLAPGASREIKIVVRAAADAPLGASFELHVGARPPRHGVPENDAVLITITKVSTPE